MEITVKKLAYEDKHILQNLMQFYVYDFSVIEDLDVNGFGLYNYRYLDYYWVEPDRTPYVIQESSRLTGFVLVNRHTFLATNKDAHSIAEFFVLKKYRRQGVGRRAFQKTISIHPGKWEVSATLKNTGARQFWEKVIGDFTLGNFEKTPFTDRKKRIVYSFTG